MFSRRTYLSVVCSCLAPCALLLLPASGLWGSLGWDPDTQTCTILAPGKIEIRCDGHEITHAAYCLGLALTRLLAFLEYHSFLYEVERSGL